MTDFEKALKYALQFEGGYVNDPADPGGATNKGITQAVYNAYRKALGQAIRSVKEITDQEVASIYEKNYWNLTGSDKLQWPLNLVVFDAAINCGPSRASRWLDNTSGTLEERVRKVNEQRREHYRVIIKRNPKLKKFEKGWENRMKALEKIAA